MAESKWLLFIYQVPASPSTHRSYVWRKLKASGALYLQNSICLLPASAALKTALDELRAEILSRGGEAQLLPIEILDGEENGSIVARFEAQMDDEYGEFLEQCGEFHAELAKERAKRHLTFGELEENDVDLNKLKSWLPKLYARDFFAVGLRAKAASELQDCERDFALFEREVEGASLGEDGAAMEPER
jgi:hypothetical protein